MGLRKQSSPDAEPVLQCPAKHCKRHFLANTGFTALYAGESTYQEYLRVAYAFSTQLRQDQAIQLTGVPENRVARMYAACRDVTGWYMCHIGRNLQFNCGEVDLDAAKCHIDRSDSQTNRHTGRVFLLKERSSGRRKVRTLGDVEVPKRSALPPENLDDCKEFIQQSLRRGSVAGCDGGRAIESAVKGCSGGDIPLAPAIHGRKPRKQFTALKKGANYLNKQCFSSYFASSSKLLRIRDSRENKPYLLIPKLASQIHIRATDKC